MRLNRPQLPPQLLKKNGKNLMTGLKQLNKSQEMRKKKSSLKKKKRLGKTKLLKIKLERKSLKDGARS